MEMFIAFALLGLVFAGAYKLFEYGNKQTAIAVARQNMVDQAEKLFKLLQWDIASVASISFPISNTGQNLMVLAQSQGGKPARVSYVFRKPRLFRLFVVDQKLQDVRIAADCLHSIELERKERLLPSGRKSTQDETEILVRTVFSSDIHGMTKPLTHDQNSIFTMRKAAGDSLDPRWHDVGNIGGPLQTHNTLLESFKSDLDQWKDMVGADIDALVK
ncbi:hypothetical protein KBA41_02240 [Candidatus Ozemobacteraceae bacterium]|nr:hypothetical protein [Candidatus Ozemobacteraceae bacterium]